MQLGIAGLGRIGAGIARRAPLIDGANTSWKDPIARHLLGPAA